MVEVVKMMVTSFKRSGARSAAVSVSDSAASHHRPTPPPEAPGHSQEVWVSLWDHCSFLLGSGAHKLFLCMCALQESVSPALCKFLRLYGGVNGTSSKRALAIPGSTAPSVLAPVAGHC